MPPTCEALHPDFDGITCAEDYGHKGNHRHVLKSNNVLEWEQEKVKKTYNREQIISMIEQEKDKLQITLEGAGTGSRESDMLRTVIPIFQRQLFFLESILDLVKD